MRNYVRDNLIAYLVLVLGVGLSIVSFYNETVRVHAQEQVRFETEAQQATLLIKTRMDTYRSLLTAGVGFLNGVPELNRQDWQAFVSTLMADGQFPGVVGLGYAEAVHRLSPDDALPSDELGHVLALSTPIVYLEPLSVRNQRVIGYDMFAESVRREAMLRALYTGRAAISGRVTLVQDLAEHAQAGFLMYMPVYHRGMPLTTDRERMAAIKGFVYAPLRMQDLMQGVLGKRYDHLSVAIYDRWLSPDNQLFVSHLADAERHMMRLETQITIDGRQWVLTFLPLEGFTEAIQSRAPWLILWLGLLLSSALFLMLLSVLKTKDRAEHLAQRMTLALSTSEERQRFVLEASGAGVWDWNVETNEVFYSNQLRRMLGYTEDELNETFDQCEQLIHPDDLPTARASLQACLVGSTSSYVNEHRVLCRDGTYKWVLDSGAVVARDDRGRALRMVGSYLDISARKHFEDALIDASTFNQALLDNSSVGIFLSSDDRQVIRLNKRLAELFGYTVDELMHASVRVLQPSDAAFAQFITACDDIKAHKFIKNIEQQWVSKDGSLRWCRISGSVINLTRVAKGVIWTVLDISAEKAAMAALMAERDYSANILAETPVFVGAVNAQGICTYINPAGERMSGYSATEMVGRHWWNTFYPEPVAAQVPRIQALFARGQDVRDYEMTLIRKDGQAITMAWNSLLRYDAQGNLIEMLGFGYDVTDRKKAEQALLHAKAQAEAADAAKSQFLANMSHELRTPMNAVIGLSGLLMDTSLNTQQRDYLEKIHRASKMLLSIINDILDYSKIEADKLALVYAPLVVDDLLANLQALFSQQTLKKGLAVYFNFQPDTPSIIVADELRLTQVLTNLLSNAIKFTEEGSVMLLCELQTQETSQAVLRFSVSDTGIGMSEAAMAKIFQPFTQADNSITRKYGGTGLGLVISRKIVQAMGSELYVHSVPDQGSTFYFDVRVDVVSWAREAPVFEDEAVLAETPSAPLPDHSAQAQPIATRRSLPALTGVRVLLVEDNLINQEVARQLLSQWDVAVTVVDNGQQAVERLLAQPDDFDVVLMDLQMPVMGGYEAAQQIRQRGLTLPIIALTAAAMVEDAHMALAAGMNDHLTKPINARALHAMVAHYAQAVNLMPVQDVEVDTDGSHTVVLDTEYALSLLGQNEDMLHKLLMELLDQLDGAFSSIIEEVVGNAATAPHAIHALKGISGNLGANVLYQVCRDIDALYKSGRKATSVEVTRLSEAITALKQEIHEYIDAAISITLEAEPPILDAAQLAHELTQIKADLLAFNIIEPERLNEVLPTLATRIEPEHLHQWQQAIDAYDFAQALTLMETWHL